MSGDISGVTFRNNILHTSPGLPQVRTFTSSGVRFEGNAYWASGGALSLLWNGAQFSTLADWRTATGQETRANGITGLCASPGFVSPSSGPITLALATGTLPAFTLSMSSPLLGQGVDLATEFGIKPGARDFYGNPTPTAGRQGNIGACEVRAALVTQSAVRKIESAAAWCQVYPTIARNEIHVVAEQGTTQSVEIQLIDAMGRPARTWTRPGSQLTGTGLTLPLDRLAAGRYVLRVQSNTRAQQLTVLVVNE
jgi:hypothetical protein